MAGVTRRAKDAILYHDPGVAVIAGRHALLLRLPADQPHEDKTPARLAQFRHGQPGEQSIGDGRSEHRPHVDRLSI